MTELEQQLLTALEQMQNEQKAQQDALQQMFESTKQDNQGVTRAFEELFRESENARNAERGTLARA